VLIAIIKPSVFSFIVCILKHTQPNIFPQRQGTEFHTHCSHQSPPAVRMHSDSRPKPASLPLHCMLATFQHCVMTKCSYCSAVCLLSIKSSSSASLNCYLLVFTIQRTLYSVHHCQKAALPLAVMESSPTDKTITSKKRGHRPLPCTQGSAWSKASKTTKPNKIPVQTQH